MSTSLTIPDLDEAVQKQLQKQAARHGRTVQAEAREILTRSVTANARQPEDGLAAQESVRRGIEAVRGLWQGRMTTDQIMEQTRGDDTDDAYPRR